MDNKKPPRSVVRWNKTPPVIGALISDVLGLWGMPGALASKAFEAMHERRMSEARAILIEELRRGRLDPNSLDEDQHEIIGQFFSYFRVAEEGVAQRNLQLLAKLISNQTQHQILTSSTFSAWLRILVSLEQDEISTLSAIEKYLRAKSRQEPEREIDSFEFLCDSLKDLRIISSDLDFREFDALVVSLQRTGFIAIRYFQGTSSYSVTKRYIRFRGALSIDVFSAHAD
jgi:hypothetical protein